MGERYDRRELTPLPAYAQRGGGGTITHPPCHPHDHASCRRPREAHGPGIEGLWNFRHFTPLIASLDLAQPHVVPSNPAQLCIKTYDSDARNLASKVEAQPLSLL